MTVMTTHHADATGNALYAAILTNPFAMLPRLVLADWLDENAGDEECPTCHGVWSRSSGNPYKPVPCHTCHGTGRVPNHYGERAEFIRVQVDGVEDTAVVQRAADLWAGDLYSAGLVTVSPACWEPAYQTDAWRAVVRNGFVEDIRCPLEWWTGGECDCDDGYTGTPWDCPRCHGTGRTPGHGPEVVSRHPVRKVTITDREPYCRAGVSWVWLDNDYANRPGTVIPEPVYSRMMVAAYGPDIDCSEIEFHTREAAMDALSRALVDGARKKAGLPPITWEVTA